MSARTGTLVTFAGSTPNIGTSLAAFGTAFRLASVTGKRVGFLCLNLKSAKTHLYLGIDKPEITLDGLRPELKAGTLTGDKLRQYAFAPTRLNGLHVLFGNLARDQAEYYEPDQVTRLLDASREAFDLTVAEVSESLCGQIPCNFWFCSPGIDFHIQYDFSKNDLLFFFCQFIPYVSNFSNE
ncbi:hypothetical protein [Cohnella nanjingensis]|uniref:hypothetical protein n=1 Tax=Cohnella nanjingensis TaxID=1387779 RepID=UPI002483AFAB|nr:hypothetical protein [Cohnella nanjingensis]